MFFLPIRKSLKAVKEKYIKRVSNSVLFCIQFQRVSRISKNTALKWFRKSVLCVKKTDLLSHVRPEPRPVWSPLEEERERKELPRIYHTGVITLLHPPMHVCMYVHITVENSDRSSSKIVKNGKNI